MATVLPKEVLLHSLQGSLLATLCLFEFRAVLVLREYLEGFLVRTTDLNYVLGLCFVNLIGKIVDTF